MSIYGSMLQEYYVQKVRATNAERNARLASLRTQKDAEEYREEVCKKIAASFPLPKRKCALNARITGIVEAVYNHSNVTVMILDNRTTGMTGHQNNPANGKDIHNEASYEIDLAALVKSLGVPSVSVVDPYDLETLEKTVKEELQKDGVSVIICKRPCALLKKALYKGFVVTDSCKKCKACMKLGCPAILFTEDGAKIDTSLCVECGLCQKVCKFGAIEVGGSL